MHQTNRRHGRGNPMVYIMAIQGLLKFVELRHKPPVTVALILANVAIYMRLGVLNKLLPSTRQVCLNPQLVLQTMDLKRLMLSAFFHLDDTHLIYNMLSLLWKGAQLESILGGERFAATVGALLLLSHGSVICVAYGLSLLGWHYSFYLECAVGFSAVLFAMKTVHNASVTSSYVTFGSFSVPSRHAAWLELIVTQLMIPQASLLGHFSGIMGGLIFLNANHLLLLAFTLQQYVIRSSSRLLSLLSNPRRRSSQAAHQNVRRAGNVWSHHGEGNLSGLSEATSATEQRSEATTAWRCSACTYDNNSSKGACEICSFPRSRVPESHIAGSDFAPSAPPWLPVEAAGSYSEEYLSQEGLHQARLARFQQ
eukprot:jgi/Mesen1/10456/ME000082S09963